MDGGGDLGVNNRCFAPCCFKCGMCCGSRPFRGAGLPSNTITVGTVHTGVGARAYAAKVIKNQPYHDVLRNTVAKTGTSSAMLTSLAWGG